MHHWTLRILACHTALYLKLYLPYGWPVRCRWSLHIHKSLLALQHQVVSSKLSLRMGWDQANLCAAGMPAAQEPDVRKFHDGQRSRGWISPSETFLVIYPLIMVLFSKFKISLEAEKALYLLILLGHRYANEFLRTCSGRPCAAYQASRSASPYGEIWDMHKLNNIKITWIADIKLRVNSRNYFR